MKHTVCFIDDTIPVSQYGEYFNDTDIISSSVIKYLLKKENTKWRDDVVKNMCKKLVDEPEKWSVSAFTSPDFYDNYIKETVYAPEIVIYDWDYNYGPGSNESEEHLLEILKTSYTMIFVFSENEHIDDINQIIQNDEFKKYGDRLCVVDKTQDNSIEYIFSQIEQKEQNNFSFAYGFEIIQKSNKAINKVLSELSELSISDFMAFIGVPNGNTYNTSTEDFLDAITPKYKSLLQSESKNREVAVSKSDNVDLLHLRKIWAYRMYDNLNTQKVRMGDVVRNSENDFFLVVSSDCHLNKFPKSNFGFLTMVPMYPCGTIESIKILKKNGVSTKLTSLTSNNKSSMTILPCIPIDGKLIDFMIVPKGIVSVALKEESGSKNLLYDNLVGYTKITSISDPFKSPLVQYIFDNITGYGCPNFPNEMIDNIYNKIKQMLS